MKKFIMVGILLLVSLFTVNTAQAGGFWGISYYSGSIVLPGEVLAKDTGGMARFCFASYGFYKNNEAHLLIRARSGYGGYSFTIPMKLNETVVIAHPLESTGPGTLLIVTLVSLNKNAEASFRVSVK